MPAKVKQTYNRSETLYCKKKFGLDEDLQFFIKSKYKEYKNLLQLAKETFKEDSIKEDSDEYNSVKNFVARLHKGTEIYNFSEDQINYIADNGEIKRPAEIARDLFPEKANALIVEIKGVVSLLEALDLKYKEEITSDVLEDYSPPKTDHKVLALINRANPDAKYAISNLDSEKRRNIAFLKKTLSSPRFIAMMNAIRNKFHRIVFEEEFVKEVYDKPDLIPAEANAYMSLANEYVISLLVTEQMADLNDRLKEATDDDDEGRKYTKNISDSLSSKIQEFNHCQKRMDDLRNHLIGKRSERLKHMIAANESLVKYIELCKREEGRRYMLKLSEKRQEILQKEAKRIEDLSDLVAEIHGVSIDEILKF